MTEPNSGPTVLLVEDDVFLLDMYSTKFTQNGFVVESCQSVAEALTALRGGVKPAVVLFDIVMPGEDGFSLLRSLKSEKLAEGACLIGLTNQSSDADKKQAIDLGADKYIIKASMIPSEVVSLAKQCIVDMGQKPQSETPSPKS